MIEARKEKNKSETGSTIIISGNTARLRNSLILGEKSVISKKRGRPRKLKLEEARRKLQQLLYTCDIALKDEVLEILSQVNKQNDLDMNECKSSKLGNLLKKVFCSKEYAVWQKQEDVLRLVKETATKLINSERH